MGWVSASKKNVSEREQNILLAPPLVCCSKAGETSAVWAALELMKLIIRK